MIPNFCFTHYSLNCPLCYPASTAPKAVSATNNTRSIAAVAPTIGIRTTANPGTGAVPSNPTTGSFAANYALFSAPSPAKRKSTLAVPKKENKRIRETVIDDEVACEIFQSLKLPTQFLNSGKVLAWALQPDDPAFINIHNYVAASQEHGFGVKILSILRIIVKTDDVDIVPFSEDPSVEGQNRMMLWHGTKSRVLSSILQNGLKLPNSHGQMFGPGIYFADRVSKSCQYCDPDVYRQTASSHGYLFLCDVLLGKVYKAFRAQNKGFPGGYQSIKGCGSSVPDPDWNQTIDGCVWPIGPTVQNKEDPGNKLGLFYNEYIVYNTKQVQPKYLVKVQFTKKPVVEILY